MITKEQKEQLCMIKQKLNDKYEDLMHGPILQAEFDEIDIIEGKRCLPNYVFRILELEEFEQEKKSKANYKRLY